MPMDNAGAIMQISNAVNTNLATGYDLAEIIGMIANIVTIVALAIAAFEYRRTFCLNLRIHADLRTHWRKELRVQSLDIYIVNRSNFDICSVELQLYFTKTGFFYSKSDIELKAHSINKVVFDRFKDLPKYSLKRMARVVIITPLGKYRRLLPFTGDEIVEHVTKSLHNGMREEENNEGA